MSGPEKPFSGKGTFSSGPQVVGEYVPLEAKPQGGIKRSYVVAGVLLVIATLWVGSGYLLRAEKQADAAKQPKPAESSPIQTVRVRTVAAEMRRADLVIRGQTQALRKVELKSETSGTVSATPVEPGTTVKQGDVICQLKVDAREAQLAQARAAMRQKKLEYEGSKSLQEKGFRSETAVAGDLAEYQASMAMVEQMEQEMENTRIRAPFDGFVDSRRVDVGDFMSPGTICAVVIDQDPFLVVGQVSERDVGAIKIGDGGYATLVTGERVEGKVRFVSKSSDEQTRTFRLELEFPNPSGQVRDGITAEIHIQANAVAAHRLSPAILALDERGALGIRIVDKDGIVRFAPVTIIADGVDGIWVTGLPQTVTVITVGQEFVAPGQKVNAVPEGTGTAVAPPAAVPTPPAKSK